MENQPTSTAPQPVGAPSTAPQANANQILTPPFVPTTWPGAFGLYKYSKAAIRLNLWAIVIIYLFSIVISFVQYIPRYGLALYYLTLPLVALVYLALYIVQLEGVKGVKIEAEEALKKSIKYLLNGIGLYLFIGLVLFLSLLAFIIPFFFVFPRVILAPYFMIDRNINFVDAFSASWNESKGHAGKVYGMVGANIVYSLLFLTIIGIPFSIYFLIMYMAAGAVIYYYIVQQQSLAQASAPVPVGAAPPQPQTNPMPPAVEQTPQAPQSETPNPVPKEDKPTS